jgi:metal-responsive CopG/Arc/MetJ family transcriptional regulator
MKVAISIPDSIFEEAERLAEKLEMSRSKLYVEALQRLLCTYRQEAVTTTLDEIYAKEDSTLAPSLSEAQHRAIGRETW